MRQMIYKNQMNCLGSNATPVNGVFAASGQTRLVFMNASINTGKNRD